MDYFGPWEAGSKLNDGGGTVKLQRPDDLFTPIDGGAPFYPMLVEDTVRYDDEDGWPAAADGTGASLQRISDPEWSDDPANWKAQDPPLESVGTLDYDAWAAIVFPPGTPAADQLKNADPDGDGLTNYGEFALVLNPLASDSQQALSMSVSPTGDLHLTYNRRSGEPSMSVALSQSADLITWQPASVDLVAVTSPEPGVQTVEVKFSEPLPSPTFRRLMFRIDVTGP